MIVDTTPGEWTHITRHEGSITHLQGDSITAAHPKSNKLQDGSEPTLEGNHCHGANVCHEVSNDNTEGNKVLTVEVLPSVIINTEVNSCNSISGFKTQRGEKQGINRVGFISRNKDTRRLFCPRVWVKSFSEHLDVKIELNFHS